MTTKDNSVHGEETTSMENVSLEETNNSNYDVEKAKAEPGKGDKKEDKGKNRRFVMLGAGLAFLVLCAITVAVAVTQANKSPSGGSSVSSSSSALTAGTQSPSSEASTNAPSNNPFGEIAKLPPFSAAILDGYESTADFEADLTNVAKYIASSVIMWNVENANQYHYDGMNHVEGLNETASTNAALAAGATASIASAATEQVQARTAGGKTNNQEKDADEADIVKSDGEFLYMAYGDYLLVLTRDGEHVTQVPMPKNEPDEHGWTPKNYIRSLMLTEEHVAIVSTVYVEWDSKNVIQERGATRVLVYTKPTTASSDMVKVATKTINGSYHDGRFMEDSNSIQILTSAEVTTYDFTDALNVQYFPWMSKEDYIQAASELAANHLIPRFVRAITQGLSVDGEIPKMLRLNAWRPEGYTEPWRFADYYGAFDESLRYYKQVTSINVDDFATAQTDVELGASTSAFFSPTYSAGFYGTDDTLVLSMSHSEWDEAAQRSHESLFLVNLNIEKEGGSVGTAFNSVALVDGRMASRFSLDVQGNDLRVATTVQKWFPLDNVFEQCGDQYFVHDSCLPEEKWNECFDVAIDCPTGKLVKTGCPYTFTCDVNATVTEEDLSSTDNDVIVFDISQKGQMTEVGRVRIGEAHEVITSVRFGEAFSYAMTFDERDPFYVLELNAGEAPKIKGSVTLQGFTRYLHPLNEEATMLVGIGQNTTGTGLDQVNSGVLISVFDVSDPSEPVAVDSYMLVDPEEQGSYSVGEHESRSIQYKDGKLILPASIYPSYSSHNDDFFIMPRGADGNSTEDHHEAEISGVGQETFEGFVVLEVGNAASNGIQELYRVNHYQERPKSCYYCDGSFFEKRSFVFDDGSLVSMYGRTVTGTNLANGEELWSVEPQVEGEVRECCW